MDRLWNRVEHWVTYPNAKNRQTLEQHWALSIGQLTPPLKFHQFSLLPLWNIIDIHLLMLMHNPDLTATSTNIRTSSSSLARLAVHTCHLWECECCDHKHSIICIKQCRHIPLSFHFENSAQFPLSSLLSHWSPSGKAMGNLCSPV